MPCGSAPRPGRTCFGSTRRRTASAGSGSAARHPPGSGRTTTPSGSPTSREASSCGSSPRQARSSRGSRSGRSPWTARSPRRATVWFPSRGRTSSSASTRRRTRSSSECRSGECPVRGQRGVRRPLGAELRRHDVRRITPLGASATKPRYRRNIPRLEQRDGEVQVDVLVEGEDECGLAVVARGDEPLDPPRRDGVALVLASGRRGEFGSESTSHQRERSRCVETLNSRYGNVEGVLRSGCDRLPTFSRSSGSFAATTLLAVDARRRRRPSRPCRTSPRCRAPSTSSARPRPSPPRARARRRACRRARRSPTPSLLLDAVQEHLERPLDVGRQADAGCAARGLLHVHRMPAIVRPRIKPKPVVIAGALVGAARAGGGRSAGNGGFAPVPPESPNAEGITSELLVRLGVLPRDLPARPGPAARLRRPLPAAQPPARRRRRADPRLEPPRARVDGRSPSSILFAIAAFVFVKLPGIQDVPAATGGRENLVVEVIGHAVHVGVPLPERRRRGRPAARARGPNGRAARHGAGVGRDPLVVDPGARRQDRRDPRHRQRDVVRRQADRAVPRASAPSSAASTTRR